MSSKEIEFSLCYLNMAYLDCLLYANADAFWLRYGIWDLIRELLIDVLWGGGVVGGSSYFPQVGSLATSLLELQNICEHNLCDISFWTKWHSKSLNGSSKVIQLFLSWRTADS